MKKSVAFVLVISLLISLCACGSMQSTGLEKSTSAASSGGSASVKELGSDKAGRDGYREDKNKVISYGTISFQLPDYYGAGIQSDDKQYTYYYIGDAGKLPFLMLCTIEAHNTVDGEVAASFFTSAFNSMNGNQVGDVDKFNVDGMNAFSAYGEGEVSGNSVEVLYVLVWDENVGEAYIFGFTQASDSLTNYFLDGKEIVKSVVRESPTDISAVYNGSLVEGTIPGKSGFTVEATYPDGSVFTISDFEVNSEPLVAGETNHVLLTWNGGEMQVDIAGITQEMLNALDTAESYNALMPFSKKGLYDQLVDAEGFTNEAAQYAVDNVDADWCENALEQAKGYYEEMAMSKQGVYKQLISSAEGYTEEEAQYAIDNLD